MLNWDMAMNVEIKKFCHDLGVFDMSVSINPGSQLLISGHCKIRTVDFQLVLILAELPGLSLLSHLLAV